MTDDFPVSSNGLPLRLSFAPDAIRQHFESDKEIEPLLDAMTDDELKDVGEAALADDRLYAVFHEILCDAVRGGSA